MRYFAFFSKQHPLSRVIVRLSALFVLTASILVFQPLQSSYITSLTAQTLTLFNVNTAQFPRVVGANFFALDTAGNPLRGLTETTMRLSEEGITRRVLSVSCPPPTPPRALSLVLTLDVSGSMAAVRKSGVSNMVLAKRAANAVVNALRLGTSATLSEAAITSFDNDNYLNQDWTTDKTLLENAINALEPSGGTDYDAGFVRLPAGALEVAKTGRNKRVVIFLTDGQGGGTEESIVNAALRNDITIYCVTLGLNAPQVLRNAAQRTGGVCIENVQTSEETVAAFLTILQIAEGKTPCQITWESASSCAVPSRTVRLTLPESLQGTGTTASLNASTSYTPPESAQVRLRIEPSSVRFDSPQSTMPQEETITVTASNANFTVQDILMTGDSSFSITPRSFTLRAGEERRLTLRYTPRGAGYALASFAFQTDTCEQQRLFASVFSRIAPVSPTLKLLFPNGGEEFVAGSDSIITWTGVSPLDTVRLEFSIDSGATWQTITEEATGLRYAWSNIPNLPSNRCLMRVTQLVGSPQPDIIQQIPTDVGLARFDIIGDRIISSRTSQIFFWTVPNLTFFSAMQRHQTNVTSIDVNPDSTGIATADAANNIVTWNPTTGRITGGIVGNIGRVAAYSPDGRILAVAGNLGSTGATPSVIRFYDTETSQLQRTITIPGASVEPRRIVFSPDGGTLGLVRSDGTMLFWRISNNFTSMGFGTSIAAPWGILPRDIRDAAFQQQNPLVNAQNPQQRGTLLAIAVQRGTQATIDLWNWQTQRFVRTLTESANRAASGTTATTTATQRIFSINFSRDGSRIITGVSSGVGLWNIGGVNQDPPKRVRFPAPVTFAEFHPDGKRFLAVSSADSNGYFYTFSDPLPLQSDTSDRVWAIVAPNLRADSVDMRAVTVGLAKDSIVRAFLRNIGTYSIRIDSIFFTGNNPDEFEIVAGLPVFLLPGDSAFVEFRFRPRAAGERTAIINIAAQHQVLEYGIRGIGVTSSLAISPRFIDFRSVVVGTRRDSTVVAIVRNTGRTPITISGVQLGGPDARQFALLSQTAGFTLAGGETRSIVVRFAPTSLGRTSGSVLFFVGNSDPVVVQLFGIGVATLPPPPCSVRLLDTSARPNDRICISLVQSCSEPPELSTSLTVLLSYNATLLQPIGMTPQGVVASGIRYIPITLNLLPVATGASVSRVDTRPLENLCFDVTLGNTTATRLNLEILSPRGAFINATSANFRLITSQAGGAHLYFSPQSRLVITSIAPNPASEQLTVRYNNVFVEALTLTIVDVFGRVMLTQPLMPAMTTGNEVSVVVRELPPGVYVVRIRSPRETASQRLTIVR
jgi:WD40 repeat protein